MNQAFLRMWRLPDDASLAQLDFEGLMRLVVRAQARPMSPASFNDFVTKRTALVRAGHEDPRDVRLRDGRVIRVKCKPLPDERRMLVYTDVTDLVQQADIARALATIDDMTGLFNRRHFLSLAEIEWNRYQRYLRPLSLMMIDIDRFKSINDRFGHYVGDQVIISVGEICREQKRKPDFASRFGGEEFLILLPETGAERAFAAGERLREKVATREFSAGITTVGVTVSIGIAEAHAKMASIFDLIKQADRGLYAAKESGRNRVCLAPHVS
jgi:diguanylate cyclase (GGDEF)-like protein